MKWENILNNERINALNFDKNAYVSAYKTNTKPPQTQTIEKVLFPEAYENASQRYNMNNFTRPQMDNKDNTNSHQQSHQPNNCFHPMFDMKSILPMLMSGKFNDMLAPIMSMFGGGSGAGKSGMDFAKIFELFKPKSKAKKVEKEEDVSSKFDDFIIIED